MCEKRDRVTKRPEKSISHSESWTEIRRPSTTATARGALVYQSDLKKKLGVWVIRSPGRRHGIEIQRRSIEAGNSKHVTC